MHLLRRRVRAVGLALRCKIHPMLDIQAMHGAVTCQAAPITLVNVRKLVLKLEHEQ